VYYGGKDSSFAFTPLGSTEEMTVEEILTRTETGQAYGPSSRAPPLTRCSTTRRGRSSPSLR